MSTIISSAKHEKPNGSWRTVVLYSSGVRQVSVGHDGEWWATYIIVPRKAALAHVRLLRKCGRRVNDFERFDVLPPSATRLIGCEHYSGPGRSFARSPFVMRSNRHHIVIAQSGGLDI